MDKIKVDMKENGLTERDTVDRAKWRGKIQTADPTAEWDKCLEEESIIEDPMRGFCYNFPGELQEIAE